MSKWKRATVACLSSAVLLTTACTTTETSAEPSPTTATMATKTPSQGPETCRVTPVTQAGVPEGILNSFDGPTFGQENLWVNAWWAEEPTLEFVRENDRIKYPSFTTVEGQVTDELGPPLIQVQQLDGTGEGTGTTGGYATEIDDSGKTLNWWPTVIDFSGPGCWEVTQTVGQTSITYVVEI